MSDQPNRPETDAERAYRLLAEDMKADGLISDYDMQPQPDYDYLDDDDEDDDYFEPGYMDDVDIADYSAGFQDGYDAGQRSLRWRYLLTVTIPYRWRARWWSLRRKLFPDNRHIPF